MTSFESILNQLPYGNSFRFVDGLLKLDDKGCEGYYTFKGDEFFYQSHFKHKPVTPGVILGECMAQIGLVCLGIHLRSNDSSESTQKIPFVLTESELLFEKAVYPPEKVRVVSNVTYWRLGKLKCEVQMFNSLGDSVCRGTLAGIMLKDEQ